MGRRFIRKENKIDCWVQMEQYLKESDLEVYNKLQEIKKCHK